MTIILLTGNKGCGKTTACKRLAQELACSNKGGVLAPAMYDEHGTKIGIMMRDMATDIERQLATVAPVDSAEITVGQYAFDDDVTAWGLDAILNALSRRTDMVFVDEIGPLELWKRAGFAPALSALDYMVADCAILIVRPSLVNELAGRLAHLDPVTIALTLENRDTIPGQLAAMLGR